MNNCNQTQSIPYNNWLKTTNDSPGCVDDLLSLCSTLGNQHK